MRKIIAGMFITLDGVIEAPEKWNPPFYNQEMTDAVQGQMSTCGTHLYGRRSYQLFRSVFTGPAADQIPHALLMNQTPKIVVSTTLTDADWGPTTVIGSDVVAQLTDLKRQPGKNINIGASGTLVRFLLKRGLLDELRLLVHPIMAGPAGTCSKTATSKCPSSSSTPARLPPASSRCATPRPQPRPARESAPSLEGTNSRKLQALGRRPQSGRQLLLAARSGRQTRRDRSRHRAVVPALVTTSAETCVCYRTGIFAPALSVSDCAASAHRAGLARGRDGCAHEYPDQHE
jgi:dihydrofolate reductase